MQKTTNK